MFEIKVGPKLKKAREIVAVILVLWCLFFAIKVPTYFDKYVPQVQSLSITLGLVLLLHFLSPKRGATAIKLYDIIPLLLSLPAIIFGSFFYNTLVESEAYGFLDTQGTILLLLLAVGNIFATYRRIGLVVTILIAAFVLIARYQNYLPGMLNGPGYSWDRLAFNFYMTSHGIFGIPFRIACSVLIGFVIFGELFQQTGGGRWFISLGNLLVGPYRGGTAKASVVASSFFAMISGSPSANAATIGVITIPTMKAAGYSPALAGGIEAVASTGGQITPPVMGAIAFVMAEWLGMPYYSIALAAFIPAFFYYLVAFLTIHFEAVRNDRPLITAPRFRLLKK